MYLQLESKIEPFEPDPSEKIHFFQNRYMFCTKKMRDVAYVCTSSDRSDFAKKGIFSLGSGSNGSILDSFCRYIW